MKKFLIILVLGVFGATMLPAEPVMAATTPHAVTLVRHRHWHGHHHHHGHHHPHK